MKTLLVFATLIIVVSLGFVQSVNAQTIQNLIPETNEGVNFRFTYQSAHPNAKALMKDDFFWSEMGESSPFGNDEGADAAYGFKEWRQSHKGFSPVNYLKELIADWQYPPFDYNELDTAKIRAYIHSKSNPSEEEIQQLLNAYKEILKNTPDTLMKQMSEQQIRESFIATSKDIGGAYLSGQDNAIIGICFAQFAMEGHIDNDIKAIAIKALTRQQLPMLMNKYDTAFRPLVKKQLSQMLEVVKKAP